MATKITLPVYAEQEIRQRVSASSELEQQIIADALPWGVCLERVLKELKFKEKAQMAYLENAKIIMRHEMYRKGEIAQP